MTLTGVLPLIPPKRVIALTGVLPMTKNKNDLPSIFSDLTKLRYIPPQTTPLPSPAPKHQPGEKFLKGPIPMRWWEAVARLPGRRPPVLIGLLLWHLAGCTRRRTVKFCLQRAVDWGMNRRTARRAMRRLEKAGLVTVAHWPGRCLDVTINDAP
jgi:hypothetical protein